MIHLVEPAGTVPSAAGRSGCDGRGDDPVRVDGVNLGLPPTP